MMSIWRRKSQFISWSIYFHVFSTQPQFNPVPMLTHPNQSIYLLKVDDTDAQKLYIVNRIHCLMFRYSSEIGWRYTQIYTDLRVCTYTLMYGCTHSYFEISTHYILKEKNNFTNSCLLLEITWDYPSKLVDVMEFQLSYFKSWKMMLWKCCTQYASKFGKLSGHRTGKGPFSFQSLRKAIPKNAQTTTQLHSSHKLIK